MSDVATITSIKINKHLKNYTVWVIKLQTTSPSDIPIPFCRMKSTAMKKIAQVYIYLNLSPKFLTDSLILLTKERGTLITARIKKV